MERCPHCSAATRPGAKFCTSCGTRLDDQVETKAADSNWANDSDAGETPVDVPAVTSEETDTDTETATPEPDWAAATSDPKQDADVEAEASDPSIESMWAKRPTDYDAADEASETPATDGSSWFSKWPESSTKDHATASPADRFRDALDSDEKQEESSEASATDRPIFPARKTWDWGTPSDDEGSSLETSDIVASSSTSDDDSEETAAESAVSSPQSDSDDDSGERRSAGSAILTTSASEDEARNRATTLVDELRGLIWQIGAEKPASADEDQGIINNVRRIRGETRDFSDLQAVIDAVKENPRDIDALRDLGQQADRLQDLLESHATLTGALEDIIRQGQ